MTTRDPNSRLPMSALENTSPAGGWSGLRGPESPAYLQLKYATAVIANAADAIEPAAEAMLGRICGEVGFILGRAHLRLAGMRDAQSAVWVLHEARLHEGVVLTRSETLTHGPADASPVAEVLRSGRPEWWKNLTAEDVDESTWKAGARCGCAVPVLHHDMVIGVIELFYGEARPPDTALLEALEEVAVQLGQVVGRVRGQMRALRQQAELARMSRVASMREVAGSLAHEVNQPLAAIVNYAGGALQLLNQGRADQEKLQRVLDQVRVQAKRASGIIHDLRELLRRSDGKQDRLEVNGLVAKTVDLLETTARDAGVDIRLDLGEELPQIVGDDIQLQQVLINLILNGVEAISSSESKGRGIVVSTRADEQVEIAVRDSGPGMSAELLPELFTPFFTTKPHGLGIGLSIGRSIVEFHGGRLSGDNNSDGGMTFRLRLPCAGQQ